jgi:putative transcriptional regulator
MRDTVRNDLRLMRADRGISQAELAQAMGVSRQTINSIETDRYTPSLPLAIALARYFKRPVEEIFHVDHEADIPR